MLTTPRHDREFDLVLFGATGYTGRLTASHLARTYGTSGGLRWAIAGRDYLRLCQVGDDVAGGAVPVLEADAGDPHSLARIASRARCIISTVGPYQRYGSGLVAACARHGTDYVDLCGETHWMRWMIDAHQEEAERTGARIVFSCGFDSAPFELGVYLVQQIARVRLGRPTRRVKGRIRKLQGGVSGGTTASGRATMEALARDTSLIPVLTNPFALTPGFEGPPQPRSARAELDPDVGGTVTPFAMSAINIKNVHRSNYLMGHPYGRDFVYDEMAMTGDGAAATFANLGQAGGPAPGDGPSPAELAAGYFDLLFIGIADDGARVRASVSSPLDPGYGCTSRMLGESAIALIEATSVPGGVWTPGAALAQPLLRRFSGLAEMRFHDETEGPVLDKDRLPPSRRLE